ncbi:EAL domain-containing protein, partial [Campylobacter sp. 2018MI01]
SLNKSNNSDNIILGKEQFRTFIYNAMNNNDFCFASQEVLDTDNNVYHKELYLRLKYKNELKNASYFMPIVNELNLSKELDIYVLSKALSEEFKSGISVNISNDLIKAENYQKLEKIFKTRKNEKVYLELAMSKELNIRNLIEFSRFAKTYDIALGLDHFTLNKENLSILNELNISYIKVQARTLLDLLEDVNASGAKNALEIILNSKGIKIIAIGIEDEETYNKIKELNINLVQGNYTSKVKEEI